MNSPLGINPATSNFAAILAILAGMAAGACVGLLNGSAMTFINGKSGESYVLTYSTSVVVSALALIINGTFQYGQYPDKMFKKMGLGIIGANSFAYSCIVGSGERAKAVVPTATNKVMQDGELVMIGIAPRVNGYAGTFGDILPVNGVYTPRQKELINHLRETMRLTKAMLKPGMTGREIDAPGRKYYEKHGLEQYIVCPFAHSIGLMEAEAPFFGPNGDFVLVPGMTVMVDISFFNHPELYGGRIETGYVITETGCEPLSPKMDAYFMKDL